MNLQYDGPITLAVGASRSAAHWKNKTMQWSEFLGMIQNTTQTRETLPSIVRCRRASRIPSKM